MKTLSAITLLPYSKEERKSFIEKAKSEIIDSGRDIHKILANIKAGLDVLDALLKDKDIRKQAIAEMREDKVVVLNNAEISYYDKKTYNYSFDTEWTEVQEQIELLKAKQKARETLLKSVKNDISDLMTGEILESTPFTSTEILTIKLK